MLSYFTALKGVEKVYSNGFKKFFWAFLFILVDFRVKGFDILPDVIGYILIYSGLSTFEDKNKYFERAKGIALTMVVISIYYIYASPGSNLEFSLGTVIGIIGEIISLLLVYSVFMGIRQMGQESRKDDIILEAESSWRFYLTLTVVTLAQLLFMFAPVTYIYYIIILFFANIFVLIKIMKFMHMCKHEFRTL